MKYFLDTEFIETGPSSPIKLISVALVAEDGRELYLQNADCQFELAGEWVYRNVFLQLDMFSMRHLRPDMEDKSKWDSRPWIREHLIHKAVIDFVGDDKSPEFWGYYADYDWVVFCQIFGTMMDLPAHFPRYCRDLKQTLDAVGNPTFPKPMNEHHALEDARWIKRVYEAVDGKS